MLFIIRKKASFYCALKQNTAYSVYITTVWDS